ncbi:hypothetical protein HY224_00390 [Candidatus Uhrbacteria bacterium]|nr:hypothetical protein [Candidatus Uhrbacteria bacterium]
MVRSLIEGIPGPLSENQPREKKVKEIWTDGEMNDIESKLIQHNFKGILGKAEGADPATLERLKPAAKRQIARLMELLGSMNQDLVMKIESGRDQAKLLAEHDEKMKPLEKIMKKLKELGLWELGK